MWSDLSRWSPQQQQAIRARGENVLVSAGAGSGKTSVLVERVVQCVLGDGAADLQRLLVVTFTEAAAAEMRRRIADRLQQVYEQALQSADASLAMQVVRQLEQVDQAQISTLHSFCMNVVRRNFLTLGLEPVFSLMSEDEGTLLQAEVLDELLEAGLANDDGGRLAGVVRKFGTGQPSRFANLVMRLYTFAVSQPDPRDWLRTMAKHFLDAKDKSFSDLPWTPIFLGWALRQVHAAVSQFQAALAEASAYEELASYKDNLEQLAELSGAAAAVLASAAKVPKDGQAEAAVAAAVQQLRGALSVKSPRAQNHPAKEIVQEKRTNGIKRLQKLLPILERGGAELQADITRLAPDVAVLAAFVERFMDKYQAAKLARNWLDFNDLEHYALQALRDPHSGEAKRMQEQYVEVFVDEYQDTSPIQDAIVSHIARPQGNVFVVGDVKQSIYRFRMAEPNLFLDKYGRLGRTEPGQVIDLTANYRSRVEVVHMVNLLFEQIFSTAFGHIDYDDRTKMVAGAEYPPATADSLGGPVEVHLISRDVAEAEVEEEADELAERTDASSEADTEAADAAELSAIEKEALVISQRILEWMGQVPGYPHRQVWDAKARQFRPLQYRDIVVLLRSVKTRMNPILEVFRQRGIPAYGATSTGFYGSLEVQWLLAALSAVDNPRREIAFAALLRSPLGRFTDEELALVRLVRRGNFYDAWKAAVNAKEAELSDLWPVPAERVRSLMDKIHAFAARLKDWRTLARRAKTEDVLRRMVEDTAFEHYLSGMTGGDVRKANLHVLLDKARSFDKSSTDGVYGFVEFATAALKHEVDIGEARTLGENEDVVRVMTIHQSKGLEYPVVFVADLGKMFYRDPLEASFPLHREYGFGPQCVDPDSDQKWPTVASIAIEESDKTEFLAEEARVLYVALTRAREQLVLVGSTRDVTRTLAQALERSKRGDGPLALDVMMEAKSALDWILPALMRHPDGQALRSCLSADTDARPQVGRWWGHPARFTVHLWGMPGTEPVPALPADESAGLPPFTAMADVERYLNRLAEAHPDVVAAAPAAAESDERWRSLPGKVSATDLRRLWVARNEARAGGQHRPFTGAAERLLEDPRLVEQAASPTEQGVAFHKVMQHLDLRTVPNDAAVRAELARLASERILDERELAAVHVGDVLAFLQSDVGARLSRARRVLREQPFFQRLDVPAAAPGATYAVVQGVIDCLAETEDGWLLVDYKTDNIRAEHAESKAREYAAQIAVYLQAVSAVAGAGPVEACLYFVRPRVFVPMTSLPLDRLFQD